MNALCAVSLALSVIAAASATACYFALRAAMGKLSKSSQLAELQEIRDDFTKLHALVKRINQREVMRDRRDSNDSSSDDGSGARPGESSAAWKARMRSKLLVPGKPVAHR